MEHFHNHHNHTFSRKHLREHPICLATIFYGALVIIGELIILSFVTDMHLHDFLSYEGVVQLIHLVGIIILAIVNYRWIHRVSGHNDTPRQATTKFFGVSVVILIAHIVLLHVIPRWVGFELHHHDEAEHTHGILSAEMIEYLTLGAIIVFVTLAFRFQDTILHKLHLKNKYTFMLGSGVQKNHHHHHWHHHH